MFEHGIQAGSDAGKMNASRLAFACLFLTFQPVQAESLSFSHLSMRPPVQCKGAGRPAPRTKETIRTESVAAPASNIDLDGDGWCDWIISLPYPTNTQLPEYRAGEAILLGTPEGARSFGNMKRLKAFWKRKLPVPEGLVVPGAVTGMAPVLVAYAAEGTAPYFAGFSSAYPDFWGNPGSYRIYRWNHEFDMPQEVSKHDYAFVMRFWQKEFCRGQYANRDFLRPDIKNEEHPLEIFVCAPWVQAEVGRAGHDTNHVQ